MTRTQKIEKALINKGWKPLNVEFEPISYYSTGREGGWSIEFDTDIDIPDYTFDNWQDHVYSKGIIADCYDGFIKGYNCDDVLACIELMPSNNFHTFE